MEAFSDYTHAIASLALLSLILLVMSPLSALKKQAAGLAPGGTPTESYDDAAYRFNRAYLNGVETLPVFLTVTVLAMLTGVSPFWVNLLASLALVSRVVMLVVHIRGVGTPFTGARTFAYVGGWACMLVTGVLALVAAF